MQRLLMLSMLLLTTACGRGESLKVRPMPAPGGAALPGGPDAGAPAAVSCPGPIGPDCCEGGTRVTSADLCVDGAWVCQQGALCTCQNQVQTFFCSDFCGSDIINPPTCNGLGWGCEGGLIASTSCPADTCWGEPGDCCLQPSCESGHWVCGALKADCQ